MHILILALVITSVLVFCVEYNHFLKKEEHKKQSQIRKLWK